MHMSQFNLRVNIMSNCHKSKHNYVDTNKCIGYVSSKVMNRCLMTIIIDAKIHRILQFYHTTNYFNWQIQKYIFILSLLIAKLMYCTAVLPYSGFLSGKIFTNSQG